MLHKFKLEIKDFRKGYMAQTINYLWMGTLVLCRRGGLIVHFCHLCGNGIVKKNLCLQVL